MNKEMEIIGKRIKERRKELKLTQNDIYRECGITSGALSQIENGNRVPSAIAFYSISKTLNCSMEYLIIGKSSETKNDIKENKLIKLYEQLPAEDQEEILDMIEFKLYKKKRTAAELSRSKNNLVG